MSSYNSRVMSNDTNCPFELLRHPRHTVSYVNLLIQANLHSAAQPPFAFAAFITLNFKGYTSKHGS